MSPRPNEKQCVSIRSGTRYEFGCDIARSAGLIHNNESLTVLIRHPLAQQPRDKIVPSARGESDDPRHWARWKRLRKRKTWPARQRDGSSGQSQNFPSWNRRSAVVVCLLE
jgi:hypothetical protein